MKKFSNFQVHRCDQDKYTFLLSMFCVYVTESLENVGSYVIIRMFDRKDKYSMASLFTGARREVGGP